MKHATYSKDGLKVNVHFDIFEQLHPELWKFIIKYIANYRCESCGTKIELHSHHLDANRNNNCLANGVCVCAGCHGYFHIILNAKGKATLEDVGQVEEGSPIDLLLNSNKLDKVIEGD